MHAYRSHTCAALTAANVGETVRLSGWVHRVRDHGGVLFIDLRDHFGVTQVLCDGDSAAFADSTPTAGHQSSFAVKSCRHDSPQPLRAANVGLRGRLCRPAMLSQRTRE